MKSSKPLPAKRTVIHIGGAGGQHRKEPQHQKETSKPDNEKADQICDICAQNVPGPERERIFALGKCDHHVCYVCSARLRAICDQQECPICREKLECVVFCTDKGKAYELHDTGAYIYDGKYKIYFENATIKGAFQKLLKLECIECLKSEKPAKTTNRLASNEFQDLTGLKKHINLVHKLTFCDLCLKHNKLFPFEYSYYDHPTLRAHMRNGEPNTSHRGHPDCVLCHSTFFNQDDLLQHMSREHYHCHLCGRHNATMHVYFSDYPSLRQHFKQDHFLCERGNCRLEQFTSAFDDRIAYELHVREVHGGIASMSRGEARQQRTITLDSAPHRAPVDRRQANHIPNAAIVTTGTPATANASDPRRRIPDAIQQQIQQQRLPARSEFPTLGATSAAGSQYAVSSPTQTTALSNSVNNPGAGLSDSSQSSRVVSTHQRIIAGPSRARPSFVRCAGGGNVLPERLDEIEFPPLPEQPKPKKTKQKLRQPMANGREENLTLDQLINSSLTLSSRSTNHNKPNKTNKSAKPKALKIQL